MGCQDRFLRLPDVLQPADRSRAPAATVQRQRTGEQPQLRRHLRLPRRYRSYARSHSISGAGYRGCHRCRRSGLHDQGEHLWSRARHHERNPARLCQGLHECSRRLSCGYSPNPVPPGQRIQGLHGRGDVEAAQLEYQAGQRKRCLRSIRLSSRSST
jgi:hypothetical protein